MYIQSLISSIILPRIEAEVVFGILFLIFEEVKVSFQSGEELR